MLCTDGRGGVERIPPHRHPAHYHRLLTALEDLCRPGRAGHDGSRALPAALAEGLRLAELEHWHDETLLVISDFLFPFEELLGRLDRLSQRNNRAFLFHVIHPDEYSPTVTAGIPDWSIPARETFPFLEVCRFRSPETGALVLADPRMVRREYVHRFRELLGELRSRAAECGIGYEPVGTGEAVEAFLMRWLWRG
ncbi:MAG: hypothetical protein FJ098_09235 [Deltaproteobacteria bacterium]|nr:hypothetical protein [Deltaproteobacteria bacterium]